MSHSCVSLVTTFTISSRLGVSGVLFLFSFLFSITPAVILKLHLEGLLAKGGGSKFNLV